MRKLTHYLAMPAVGYVSTVLGIIATASLAAFALQQMTAKTYRHRDADIDRIIAKQQERKRDQDVIVLARAELPPGDENEDIAALTTGSIDDATAVLPGEDAAPPKSEAGKRVSRRAEREQRRRQYAPATFTTLPKFATAATTTLLRPLR